MYVLHFQYTVLLFLIFESNYYLLIEELKDNISITVPVICCFNLKLNLKVFTHSSGGGKMSPDTIYRLLCSV